MTDICSISIGPEDCRARAATLVLTGQGWNRDAEFKLAHQLATATKCSKMAADRFASIWVSGIEEELGTLSCSRIFSPFPNPELAPLYTHDLRSRAAALMLRGLGWANELASLCELMGDAGYIDKEAAAWLCARVVGVAHNIEQLSLSATQAGAA